MVMLLINLWNRGVGSKKVDKKAMKESKATFVFGQMNEPLVRELELLCLVLQ